MPSSVVLRDAGVGTRDTVVVVGDGGGETDTARSDAWKTIQYTTISAARLSAARECRRWVMPSGRTIGILSPGAMGSAIGVVLRAAGARVVTSVAGRSAATAARAAEKGFDLLPSVD